MLKLPVYLRGSSYYVHLRVQVKQVKKPLKTGDGQTAILRAVGYLTELLPMTIRKFEIDIQRGVFKADGEDDNRRMREALGDIERLGVIQVLSQ